MRDSLGDIYLFFVTDTIESTDAARTGEIVGFDFGRKTFLTASDDEDITSPLFFRRRINDIRKANRRLSRTQRGSNNRQKARLELARLHRKLNNQRKDFHFKLANDLCSRYDTMVFETPNLKVMQRMWGKKINDLGLVSFISILKYVASARGKVLVFIDRFEPSSKTCSVCSYINHHLELSDRQWICPACITNHDRDRSASYNILRAGASTPGLGDVSPTELTISV